MSSYKRHKSSKSDFRDNSSKHRSHSSGSDYQSIGERSGPKNVFNFERHKYDLNKMFFIDNEVLRIGTKEYDEFWTFLRRYQSSEEKAIENNTQNTYCQKIRQKVEDLKYKIPEIWSDVSALMAKTSVVSDLEDRYYVYNGLTADRINEFRNIVVLYLDFLDKQKAKALEKLRQMQMDLPIFRFKDNILDAIQRHSVVVIAGDTGLTHIKAIYFIFIYLVIDNKLFLKFIHSKFIY